MELIKKIHVGIVCDQFGNLDRGGAEVQIENTLNALNQIDEINAEIITPFTINLNHFDLIHFFKSLISYYSFANLLKKKAIPYVVSPIIFPENGLLDVLKYNFLHLTPFINKISVVKLQYFLWENAAMLFPNTDKELNFLRSIGIKNQAKIVPNGLNLSEMEVGDKNIFFENFPFLKNEQFVLNVGRIDKRKNQKKLVLACKELDIPIVLIGNISDEEFFDEIKEINYPKMFYLGPIFDKKILFGAYQACSVFCLPSTMETPGISALEAAYFNKPIVITKYGGTKYYFKDQAYYVNWRKTQEIKNAIQESLIHPVVQTRQLIEQYDWNKIAIMYLNEYKKILQ